MSKKHKKSCRTLNCFDRFVLFISAVSRCVLMSVFTSLVVASMGIASSPVVFKMCAIYAGIKKYKPNIQKKKKKKRDKKCRF